MDAKERSEKRSFIYNTVLIEAQLMPILFSTYGNFMDEFEKVMKAEVGECTEEDMNWCVEQLNWFVKRNSETQKKEKKKSASGEASPDKKKNEGI